MITSRTARKAQRVALGFCVLVLAALMPQDHVHAAARPSDTIKAFYATLLKTMKHGPSLGEKGRYEILLPAVRKGFDVPYMTRMAVGVAWNDFSAAQKQQTIQAFGRYIAATYANHFGTYSGERYEILGQQTTPYGPIVQSQLVKSEGSPVRMNYLMQQSSGAWLIRDIYLTGTISQLATLRAQFISVIAHDGAEGFISLLEHKTETLLASGAQ